MTLFGSTRWSAKVKAIALTSAPIALALFVPTTAIAQTSTDQNFESDLYSFLQSQNTLSHYMATGIEQQIGMSNPEIAQSLCYEMAAGHSVQGLHADFLTGVQMMRSSVNPADYEELKYAAELYFGSVINLGSAYYCPEYQAEVVEGLSNL
ncbi:MAG: hypothetical protein AAF810_15955 [Cyanobacteria bacterium P01_D01_bin.36]